MKKICIILILFVSKCIWGQTSIEIDADLIVVDGRELFFIKKSKGQIISKTEIRFYPTDNKLGKRIDLRVVPASDYDIKRLQDFSKNGNKYSFVVDVSNLIKQNNEHLNYNVLQTKIYNKEAKEEIYELEKYNNAYFKFSNWYYEQSSKNVKPIWSNDDEKLINFIIIKLPKNRKIVTLIDVKFNFVYKNNWNSDRKYLVDFDGLILPTKEKIISKYDGKYYEQRLDLKFLEDIDNVINRTPNWSHKFKLDNNFIKDVSFNQKLISKKFDTILIDNGFIIGIKDGETNIYNYKLKDITPQGLQSAFPFVIDYHIKNDNAICLINNKIKYIDKKGKVSDKLANEKVTICGFDDSDYHYYLIDKENASFILKKAYDYTDFDGVNRIDTIQYPLFNTKNIKSVSFLENNWNSIKLPEGSEFGKKMIVKNDIDKLGLYYAEIKNNSDNNLNIQELLPIQFDSIYYRVNYTSHILLKKNNLFGIYGLNSFPKYKSINVSEYFSRFELPNGQMGWLDKLGNEFISEERE